MGTVDLISLFVFLFLLILLSGFFSGSETGMMSLNRYRLRHLSRKKNRNARRVENLLKRPDRLLGVILIGNTFANILASSIATVIAIYFLGDAGIIIATIILTLIILIFAEVTPKTLAALYPMRFAFIVSWPLSLLLRVLYPFVWFANLIANGFLSLLGVRFHSRMVEALSRDELRSIVREATGRVPEEHLDMLTSILDLEKVTVNDIMVPRQEVIGINLSDNWQVIMDQLTNSQHTRLLVYRDEIDNVLGVLHMRMALHLLAQNKLSKGTILDVAYEPYFIPESTSLYKQLLNFRDVKRRTALVVDEYGDIIGLATMEDILEEIVGEFTTDMAAASKNIRLQYDGSYLVDGTIALRDLNRSMNWQFPVEGPNTLSGLIIEYLESIPVAGTCVKIAGYPMEVMQVKENLVKQVRVYPLVDKAVLFNE